MDSKHILVVDDDTSFRLLVRKMLEPLGYRISEAKNALDVYHVSKPDLVILDIQMPGISGHKVLASVKEDASFRAPVLVVTANSDPAQMQTSLAEGADGFMTKPLNKDTFLAKVAELLAAGA
jgi:CheY-like chemotaxis protein